MKKRIVVLLVFIFCLGMVGIPADAVEWCQGAHVWIGSWDDGTRWCSPIRPYSTHCYYPGYSNWSTGQTITVTGEVCYPTRLW